MPIWTYKAIGEDGVCIASAPSFRALEEVMSNGIFRGRAYKVKIVKFS